MKPNLPILACLVLLAGCVSSPAPFPVPPPLPAEMIPLPPVSEMPLIWQPGDWVYTGGSYAYTAGHYVPSAGLGRQWLFGHWDPTSSGPAWVPGHFI